MYPSKEKQAADTASVMSLHSESPPRRPSEPTPFSASSSTLPSTTRLPSQR